MPDDDADDDVEAFDIASMLAGETAEDIDARGELIGAWMRDRDVLFGVFTLGVA